MIIEIALTIIIIIIVITEFIKYIRPNNCNEPMANMCPNKKDYNNLTKTIKNMCPTGKARKLLLSNINNSKAINENTLFNRDLNNGFTLKYW